MTDKEQHRLFKEITETHTSINGERPEKVIIFHHISKCSKSSSKLKILLDTYENQEAKYDAAENVIAGHYSKYKKSTQDIGWFASTNLAWPH